MKCDLIFTKFTATDSAEKQIIASGVLLGALSLISASTVTWNTPVNMSVFSEVK